MSCEKFGQIYRASPKEVDRVFTSWAQGFMSGYNFSTMQRRQFRDLAATSTTDQMTHMLVYCETHPSATFAQAVLELYSGLPLRRTEN